jgi:enamine deaminase RidA (YjgF/YER057c/UK114 family)
MTLKRRSLVAGLLISSSVGRAFAAPGLSERGRLLDSRIANIGIDARDTTPGGNYASVMEDRGQLYVSGMTPRINGAVLSGRLGADASLEQGQRAAQVATLRALAAMHEHLGDLGRVSKILKVSIYMQCTPDFTQQSEVSNGASDLIQSVFAPHGAHARTSIGVYQLPKNAILELDMVAALI